jgi:hypothetical protein
VLTSLFALGLLGSAFGSSSAAAATPEFSAAEIYRNAASSVVLIFGFDDSGVGSSGTGSILTSDGVVLTNSHVIANPNTGRLFRNLVVYLKPVPISGDNQKDLTAPLLVEVIARDADMDLALLRIQDAPPGLLPIEVADSEQVEIGESVAAIGHPRGGGLWTLTTGTISSKRRDQSRDIFQTDAAINPGNSGGPLLDGHSRLVGVNTFVRRVNDQGLPLEGLNYSLRSSFALGWVNQQGVTRVGVVPRLRDANLDAEGSRSTPSDGRRLTNPAESEPPSKPSQTPMLKLGLRAPPEAQAADLEPESVPRVEPESDPEPRVTPTSPYATRRVPPPDPKARGFKGANGELMYGVPNPMIDLSDALLKARKAYEDLTRRADESVDEMNRLLDDYDNF